MRAISRETWGYGVLLILLFAIATVAVWQTLDFLEGRVQSQFNVVAATLWTLTLGFMLIAGAFGLWAIQFSAEAESKRRIGHLVDHMDYLRDGMITVDRRGRVTGCNPAARALMPDGGARQPLIEEGFPCLQPADIAQILKSPEPCEVERVSVRDGLSRALRFRSQPSRGLTLVLVSDVSAMQAQRLHNRQAAQLQLIGQIAKGVAHDFNNLLCGISGHASLLPRLQSGSAAMQDSLDTIARLAQKGVSLATHLLDLARPGVVGLSSGQFGDHVRNAAASVRETLPAGWRVETVVDDLPRGALPGALVEQIVVNLGLLAADVARLPGVLQIHARRPSATPPYNVGANCAGALLVACVEANADDRPLVLGASLEDAGVIPSVLRSIIEEAGGRLDIHAVPGGGQAFRVRLPLASTIPELPGMTTLAAEMAGHVTGRSILFTRRAGRYARLEQRLRELGARVEAADDLATALGRIEQHPELEAMVFEGALLGRESGALLHALRRLCPRAGLVVLGNEGLDHGAAPDPGVEHVPESADPNRVVMAIVEARGRLPAASPPARA